MMYDQENRPTKTTTLNKWKGSVSVTQIEKVVLGLNVGISPTEIEIEYTALLLSGM